MFHRCTMGSAWATGQRAVKEQSPYANVPSELLSSACVCHTEGSGDEFTGKLQKVTERIGNSIVCAFLFLPLHLCVVPRGVLPSATKRWGMGADSVSWPDKARSLLAFCFREGESHFHHTLNNKSAAGGALSAGEGPAGAELQYLKDKAWRWWRCGTRRSVLVPG